MNITQYLGKLDYILDVVREAFPGASPIVGGGYLRDASLGRPINDVDIFLRASDHNYELTGGLVKKIPCSPQTATYGRSDMHGAWNFQQDLEGRPVQLILTDFDNLEALAYTFDLGISRVTYDGDRLFYSPDFLEDVRDRKFRIRRADNAYELERTYRRVHKLQQKYPDYTLDPAYSGTITRARQDVPYGEADCVSCGTKIGTLTHFRNAISVREYAITGFCQRCQDSVFGPD